MSIELIAAEQLTDRLTKTGAVLLDVRSPAEFRAVHVTNATNLPLDTISADTLAQAVSSKESEVFAICRSGARSAKAAERLSELGYENVWSVDGGTDRCVETGLDVIRGESVMSLERQVRIAAGSIVLVGALLSIFVHSNFIAIPLFVGAGLVFAGITDTCGMGILLSKAPWNR
jgi:rhodanese-related sulfurtransferase